MTRHPLHITDLTATELRAVLDLAGRPPVVRLGGHPAYTRAEEIGIDVREPLEDVVHILEGYHAVIAARVLSHEVLERMVDVAAVPVVNMTERPATAVVGAFAVHADTSVSMGQGDDKTARKQAFLLGVRP